MSGSVMAQAPQMTPQMMAMIQAQMAQQQRPPMPQGPPAPMPGGVGPAAPQAPMQGAPMPPGVGAPPGMAAPPGMGGAPQGLPPGVNPQNLAMFARGGMPTPPGAAPQMALNPAEHLAMSGRFGDSIVAHLTPGEITIPLQLQSPELLKAIHKEFKRVGVSPAQFIAGSPVGSRNPATGAQEFAFLGGLSPTLLSILGGAAGSALLPGIGTEIGAGLGGSAGEAINGGSLTQDLLTGAGSALGAAAAPGVASKLGSMVGSAAAGSAASGAGAAAGAAAPAAAAAAPGLLGSLLSQRTIGAGVGSIIGSGLAGPTGPQPSGLPLGFNKALPALNPNFNALLGNTNGSAINFNGYNPSGSVAGGGYNFYAPQ